jgi:hypothetical protein
MSRIKFISAITLLISIASCKNDFNPKNILLSENEFELKIELGNKKNYLDSIIVSTIYKDSPKINKLCDWFTKSPEGWKYKNFIPSFATPEISLISNDIRFLVYTDGVVLIFKDKDGKEKEYVKKTNISEFDYLIEK